MAVSQDSLIRPTVSFGIDRDDLNTWTRLAREKGYSRSDLLRLVLSRVGLDYARSLAPTETGAGYEEPAAA